MTERGLAPEFSRGCLTNRVVRHNTKMYERRSLMLGANVVIWEFSQSTFVYGQLRLYIAARALSCEEAECTRLPPQLQWH